MVTDTIGHKVRYRAYRVDEAARSLETLGVRRPLEFLGEVTAAVYLHRTGWATYSEEVLKHARARLYRTRTSHLLVGAGWKAIECLRLKEDPFVSAPFLAAPKQEPPELDDTTSFFVMIEDVTVKGCRQAGTTVELYATELKEFTHFILGKLRVALEFGSPAAAAAFAGNFLQVPDLGLLDLAVTVDVSRRTDLAPPKPPSGGAPAPKGATPAPERYEIADLRSKWPGLAWSRWAEEPRGRAAAFGMALRQMGLPLDPNRFDLETLDGFLRKLPADTLFGSFLMDAAAYVGEAFVSALGVKARHRWTWLQTQPPQAGYVLHFDEINHFVSPLSWIAKVWGNREATTLHAYVAQWTFEVRTGFAFRHRVEFTTLGFAPTVNQGFKELEARVREDARSAVATTHVLGDARFERRALPYGDFLVYYLTGEIIEPSGPRYLPVMVVPFASPTQPWVGVLDGASPRSPLREDVAVVRLQGNDLVPLGVQVANYAEVGPAFMKRTGPLALKGIAVADKGQILTPRLRAARPEFKDFLAPLDGEETGVPLTPYATVLGRIDGVGEAMNPLTKLGLWRLRLDVSGFPCEVLVRKDRCEGIPAPGNHFTGRLWLVALVEPEAASTDSYIR